MIIGVTGGIASGKSTVTRMFQDLGAVVVSADELAREIVRPGSETLKRIAERFGDRFILSDGQLDRKALGELIFADARARVDLNSLTHPAIAALAECRLRKAEKHGAPLIIYEAPLLFESGAQGQVDKVLVVKIAEETQLARLMARDNLRHEQARARISSQMAQKEKLARADFVVDNSGTSENTRNQVQELMKRLGFGTQA